MKYGKARAIVESAIELLAEADNKYNSMEHDKPSPNRLEKPVKPVAKPSAQGRATNSPAVKFGKRTTSRRYVTRSNRWALRQIARNKSAVSEAIDQLDELSKGTYGSYIKKAARDMQDRAYDATPIAGDPEQIGRAHV